MTWILLALSVAFLLLAIFLWRRNRQPAGRLRRIEARLDNLSRQPVDEAEKRKILKALFALIVQPSCKVDEIIVYKAIDLLQLAYGQKLMRSDEPVAITGLIGSLLNQNRPDHAAAVLDVYRGLLRNFSNGQMAAEQLQTTGVIAMKAKCPYVAAKAVDILFAMFERSERSADGATVTAAIGAVRVIGKYAVKRQDHDFFRELLGRLRGFLAAEPRPAASDTALVSLISLWMHVVVSKQDETALTMLTDCVQELADRQLLNKQILNGLLHEWQDLAGIAGLNPNSRIAALLIHDMVVLAEKSRDIDLWAEMMTAVSKAVRLVIEQYGMAYAFGLLYPLLDESRKLLAEQLRFPLDSTLGSFRQTALCLVIKECLSLAEFAARTRIAYTTFDIVEEIYQYWRDDQRFNYKIKSAKKLFQLMILYWQKKHGQPARKMSRQSELMEPLLLTKTELDRLSFMTD